jgi:homoserine kinase
MNSVRLRLPATSANLGPGFDSVAVALKLHLHIDARPAEKVSIEATGRNPEICGAIENNLLLDTYHATLSAHHRERVPLHIQMRNEIPLGMGCGSSAAVRLAAVALASHFGGLGWSRTHILDEAARLEGHPDNAAACWLGGFVASATEGQRVQAISVPPPGEWTAVLVMPDQPLPTSASRAVLPAMYSRADVVANLQRVALLTAAFATARGDLLATAMNDRLHQPYRSEFCPLLNQILPLAGSEGVGGVALSGAGPAVLLLAVSGEAAETAERRIRSAQRSLPAASFLRCTLENEPARFELPG